MEEMVMMLIPGVFLVILGIWNIKGNILSIHRYQRMWVTEEDVPKYGKLMGAGTLIIGASVILTVVLQMIFHREEVFAVILAGCVVGLLLMAYGQLKYGWRIFRK